MFNIKNFLFLAGTVSLIATIRGAFLSGIHNNTTLFLIGITLALWGYGYFFDRLKKIKWLTMAIFTTIAVTIIFSAALFFYGRQSTSVFNEDVAIVLGAGTRNGEILSTLARRLDAAVSYHRQNPGALIIVSGGLGHREALTEAYVMARYLTERGVCPSRILLDELAYSTYSNMRYSRKIIDEYFNHIPSVVVITSNFHMYRSVRFARQVGLDANIYPSTVPWYAVPFAYLREVASVVKMWLIGR
ncbi:MAG: YdcF family protein [Firmicutes bacterium]|nr:YdcF family protein [Bacillota bacterium]